jgi:hypothetical protein
VSASKRQELRADVALMRELGVAKWGEIVLGPAPGAPHRELTPEEIRERIEARRQAEHDVLFGATGTRPLMTPIRGGR